MWANSQQMENKGLVWLNYEGKLLIWMETFLWSRKNFCQYQFVKVNRQTIKLRTHLSWFVALHKVKFRVMCLAIWELYVCPSMHRGDLYSCGRGRCLYSCHDVISMRTACASESPSVATIFILFTLAFLHFQRILFVIYIIKHADLCFTWPYYRFFKVINRTAVILWCLLAL